MLDGEDVHLRGVGAAPLPHVAHLRPRKPPRRRLGLAHLPITPPATKAAVEAVGTPDVLLVGADRCGSQGGRAADRARCGRGAWPRARPPDRCRARSPATLRSRSARPTRGPGRRVALSCSTALSSARPPRPRAQLAVGGVAVALAVHPLVKVDHDARPLADVDLTDRARDPPVRVGAECRRRKARPGRDRRPATRGPRRSSHLLTKQGGESQRRPRRDQEGDDIGVVGSMSSRSCHSAAPSRAHTSAARINSHAASGSIVTETDRNEGPLTTAPARGAARISTRPPSGAVIAPAVTRPGSRSAPPSRPPCEQGPTRSRPASPHQPTVAARTRALRWPPHPRSW